MIIIELAEPESEREESHDSFPILEQQTKGAVHHGHHHHRVLLHHGKVPHLLWLAGTKSS